jgi:hypothetical protein
VASELASFCQNQLKAPSGLVPPAIQQQVVPFVLFSFQPFASIGSCRARARASPGSGSGSGRQPPASPACDATAAGGREPLATLLDFAQGAVPAKFGLHDPRVGRRHFAQAQLERLGHDMRVVELHRLEEGVGLAGRHGLEDAAAQSLVGGLVVTRQKGGNTSFRLHRRLRLL